MSMWGRLICYPGLRLLVVDQNYLRAFPGGRDFNTGLNGALGLSTWNTAGVAARREAWQEVPGVHIHMPKGPSADDGLVMRLLGSELATVAT